LAVAKCGSDRLMEYKVPYILQYLMKKKLSEESRVDYSPEEELQN